MKLNKYIYSFVAIASLMLSACTPDKYSLGDREVASTDLVQGKAYSVTVDQSTNTIVLKSLMADNYAVSWLHPQGRSQNKEVTLQIPFEGVYEVTFGVMTRGGIVYGEPYQFTIENMNPALLTNPMWATLAGGVGKSKSWQLDIDANGTCKFFSGPLYFYGTADNWDTVHGVPAPDGADSWNWQADWAGNGSWLFGSTGAMDYGTMTFDLINGAHVTVQDNAHNRVQKGSFIIDPVNHTMSLTDAELLHDPGRDAIVSAWGNIRIFSLTEHTMQLGVLRDSDPSEGPCYLVYNFITTDAYNDPSLFPKDAVDILEPSTPVLPEIEDLQKKLFTTDINGVEFEGAEMTYQVSTDAAYDWMWWNGASSAWESVTKGNYGTNWAPKWDEDAVAENELTLTKKGAWSYGDKSGSYTIDGSKIVFDQEVSFFTVVGNERTIEVKGKEWQVFKCDPGSELVMGVPAEKDANGAVNTYLVAGFTYKEVGGGQTGPTVVPFIAENVNNYFEADKYFRCQLYNPWGGGGDAVDPANIKLKKNQKISVTVRLSGFTFSQPAKMVLCCNRGEEQFWETDCFNYSRAITVNGDGTYTVSWTNDTGSTVKWDDGTSALTITMQYVGYATLADESDAGLKAACAVESITIE